MSSTSTTPKKDPSKKKQKKKKAKKPYIPTNLTANLTEKQKAELQSNPEEFENVQQKKTAASPPMSSPVKTPPVPAAPPPRRDDTLSGESALLTDSSLVSLPPQSLPKCPDRSKRVFHDEKEDKVHEYKIEVERTYSQSSGTMSFDTVYNGDEKTGQWLSTAVPIKDTQLPLQRTKSVDLLANAKLEQMVPFEVSKYHSLVNAEQCPKFAHPTPEYLCGRREKQLAKDSIIGAVDEYFSQGRDDQDLTIRVQCRGAFPVICMQIGPNPRPSGAATPSSAGASGVTSESVESEVSVDD